MHRQVIRDEAPRGVEQRDTAREGERERDAGTNIVSWRLERDHSAVTWLVARAWFRGSAAADVDRVRGVLRPGVRRAMATYRYVSWHSGIRRWVARPQVQGVNLAGGQ